MLWRTLIGTIFFVKESGQSNKMSGKEKYVSSITIPISGKTTMQESPIPVLELIKTTTVEPMVGPNIATLQSQLAQQQETLNLLLQVFPITHLPLIVNDVLQYVPLVEKEELVNITTYEVGQQLHSLVMQSEKLGFNIISSTSHKTMPKISMGGKIVLAVLGTSGRYVLTFDISQCQVKPTPKLECAK